METTDGKPNSKKNRHCNGIAKKIDTTFLQWAEHITDIDISNKNLKCLPDNIQFPPNVYNLNLSHNLFIEVPNVVLKLDKLKNLDLSYNNITYFDDTPSFCHTIETLNLAYNHLASPPYWIWVDSPKNLVELNLNCNINITESLVNIYLDEFLKYSVKAKTIKIANCQLRNYVEILSTFTGVKSLEVGISSISSFSNRLEEVPCIGLDKCCDIERLNLSNTQIFNIKKNIDIFKNLVEINLSMNDIGELPQEFCNLEKLEICVLSFNCLLYLPEEIFKLKKLRQLHLDNNELCVLPESVFECESLKYVDLYNNGLYEVPEVILNVNELDLAQNFFDEPEDEEYLQKKEMIRINATDRYNGRKVEQERPDSEHSYCSTDDDEEFLKSIEENKAKDCQQYDPPSSPEDWDSDEYWVPCFTLVLPHCASPSVSPWMYYIKQKMAEGNFCPVDAHTEPIMELVKYQNKCNPKVCVEEEGQFDDYSDDDS